MGTNFEVAKAVAQARSFGLCEGCRLPGGLDPHHRMTRGSGGVHGAPSAVSNDVRNLLMLCRPCHDLTLSAADECIEKGWVIERRSGVDPHGVPALIHTVNGYGWWYLTEDGGYLWADELNLQLDFRLTYEPEGTNGQPRTQDATAGAGAGGREGGAPEAAETSVELQAQEAQDQKRGESA